MNHDGLMLTTFLHNLVRNYMKNISVKPKKNALFSIDFAGLYTMSITQFLFALLYFANQLFSQKINKVPLVIPG